ncbi:hypothetical protein [Pseudomonas helleri]|nr:hypothetical protein [Pseudomonas helleri]
MGKAKVFYERTDVNGNITLSGNIKASKVQAPKSRKRGRSSIKVGQ